jgi:hypothetical protein
MLGAWGVKGGRASRRHDAAGWRAEKQLDGFGATALTLNKRSCWVGQCSQLILFV